MRLLSETPMAETCSANSSGDGRLCGRDEPAATTRSWSKNCAPGTWPARYSPCPSRPCAGKYQDPSRIDRPVAPSRSSSQAPVTTFFGVSISLRRFEWHGDSAGPTDPAWHRQVSFLKELRIEKFRLV